MPEEWERKGWEAPKGGWPSFDTDGKIIREELDVDKVEEEEADA